jgi:hypothetical protein
MALNCNCDRCKPTPAGKRRQAISTCIDWFLYVLFVAAMFTPFLFSPYTH